MPQPEKDYYAWRAWIDRNVKRLVKKEPQYMTPEERIKLESFPTSITATLTVVGWVTNTQTVNVVGVTADSKILVSPSTTEFLAYGEAQVRATSQGAGTITFTCTTTPTVELIANIIILG